MCFSSLLSCCLRASFCSARICIFSLCCAMALLRAFSPTLLIISCPPAVMRPPIVSWIMRAPSSRNISRATKREQVTEQEERTRPSMRPDDMNAPTDRRSSPSPALWGCCCQAHRVSCSASRACGGRQQRTYTLKTTRNPTWSRQPPQTSRRPRTPETCRHTQAHSVRFCALMPRRSARQRGAHARAADSTRGCSCSCGVPSHQAHGNTRPVTGL